jgi:CheY-like chemotaxis protein
MSWHLLIIEDDDAIAESLAEVFDARGYHVMTAINGRDALDRVRTSGIRPDAILLDLLMPVMNGSDFLAARGKEPLLAGAPVIVMTAQPQNEQQVHSPVYANFAKPLPLGLLIEAVQRAVHGSPPGSSRRPSAQQAA